MTRVSIEYEKLKKTIVEVIKMEEKIASIKKNEKTH